MIKPEGLIQFFILLKQRMEENQDLLNQLDSAVGDADHGYTMVRGIRAVVENLENFHGDLGGAFDLASQAMADNAGGAIGPLLGALLAEGGIIFAGFEEANLMQIAEFFRDGAQAVQAVGQVRDGDKTLVDVLLPVALVLSREAGKAPSLTVLNQAVQVAWKAVAETADIPARAGRARYLEARAIGHQDPGAYSMALIIQAIHDFVGGDYELTPATDPSQGPDLEHLPVSGKFTNQPDQMVMEELEGFASAHAAYVVQTSDPFVLVRSKPKPRGKVGLAIGHGGGHTPSMAGFIGPGLLDADAYGPLFTCAPGVRIAKAIEAANRDAGVVLLVSNHAGDILNARLALRRAAQLGITVEAVFLGDDIATAPRAFFQERRGLGGLLFALKIGGAAAEAGVPLGDVGRLMNATNERTATLAVAARPPIHPVSGSPLFAMGNGTLEIGTGVHGEVGIYNGPHLLADEIVALLIDQIVADLEAFLHAPAVWVFLNGSGGTSLMELHILYRAVEKNLAKRKIQVLKGIVGSYFTTLDMGGFSLSLCVPHAEMLPWWDMPARSPYFNFP